nr:hypothetical protein [uncultured bacterium]
MLMQDLRYALRVLAKNRGFTLGVILCLALGIGANSAIFSVVSAALLRPMPFEEPERLVMLFSTHADAGGEPQLFRVRAANFLEWRKQDEPFEFLEPIQLRAINLTGTGEPERLRGARVTRELFNLLGVKPMLGRSFLPEEDRPGAPAPVVVLSHGLWLRSFGGDPSIVGRDVILDGEKYTVIGIMPRGFTFPEGKELTEARDLWLPLGLGPSTVEDREAQNLLVAGRLRDGISLEQAQAAMDTVARRLELELPADNKGWGVEVMPLRRAAFGEDLQPVLFILLIAVGLVLLIACANVSSLLLARASTQGEEVAIRTALGAGRLRLVRQLLTESLVLALLGGALGLLLAFLFLRPLVALSPVTFPGFQQVAIDLRVLGFTLALSVLTGILFGFVPALRQSDAYLGNVLRQAGTRASGGRQNRRLQGFLVVGEVALVLLLLVGSGLTIKSFLKLQRVDPGFDTSNMLAMQLMLSNTRYPDTEQRADVVRRFLERVSAVPGVVSASTATVLPLGDPTVSTAFSVEGRPAAPGEVMITNHRIVSASYFDTIRLPFFQGEAFRDTDGGESGGVVVVSKEFARRYWPGQSPLGKRVKQGPLDSDRPWMRVVGVVEDVRDSALNEDVGTAWYVPYTLLDIRGFRLIVRTAGDPMSFLPAVRKALREVDPEQPISHVATVDEMVSGTLAKERFNTFLLSIFAGMGLVLASMGIYGVMSYSVSQRVHEIGVRMALGAEGRQVLLLVLRQGLALTLLGLGLGLLGSLALPRVFARLLFEVDPADPAILAATSLILTTVAALAIYVPARRATRVDPLVVIKAL